MLRAQETPQSSKVSDTSNTISLNFIKADFTCPIAETLIFDAVMADGCGHIFEKEKLEEWRLELQGHGQPETCPCCRTPMNNIVPAIPFFRNALENVFVAKPELQNERYFSFSYLQQALLNKDQFKLKKLIAFIKTSDQHLNAGTDDNGKKLTSAVHLLTEYEIGREMLATDAELRSKITPEGLNVISSDDGSSGVYRLVSHHSGIKLLMEDAELRGKITAVGLNAVTKHSRSAVDALVKHHDGRRLLQEDAQLRSLIDPTILNAALKKHGSTHELTENSSSLFALASVVSSNSLQEDANSPMPLSDGIVQEQNAPPEVYTSPKP